VWPVVLSCTAQPDGFVIVKDSIAEAAIIVDPSESRQVHDVAKVLQDYIKKSTGVELSILGKATESKNSIHIGTNCSLLDCNLADSLDEEGFALATLNKSSFIILGKSDWGVEFGVYDFLERFLGVRWLMPGELWTEIPPMENLTLSEVKIVENPTYLSRRLAPINIDDSNAIGYWGRHNRLRHRIEFNHNLYKLLPVEELAKNFPEIYPIINGKRYIPKSRNDQNWQPNFSANGVDTIVATRIFDIFNNNPSSTSVSLSINDSRNFDESDASKRRRKGTLNYLGDIDVSNDYFAWVKSVVNLIAKKYPAKKYGVLAYNNVAEPPDFQLPDGVTPFITYERLKWIDSESWQHGVSNTKKWKNVANELGWYDYIYGFSYLLPRVWFHHSRSYLMEGAKLNVKHYVSEFYPNWGEGPKGWIFAKLLWNPYRNVDHLLDDWYVCAVGHDAAPKLKEYYSIWEKFWTNDIKNTNWWQEKGTFLPFNNHSYLDFVPDSYVAKADSLLSEAFALADTPTRKERIRSLKAMWDFYKAVIKFRKSNHFNDLNKFYNTRGENSDGQNEMLLESIMKNLLADSLHSLSLGYIERYFKPQDLSIDRELRLRLNTFPNLIKNGSFEQGRLNWGFWQGVNSNGSFNVSGKMAKAGAHSLNILDISLGSLYQDQRFSPGVYVVSLSYMLTSNNLNGEMEIKVQIQDKNKHVSNSKVIFPFRKLPVSREGEWTDIMAKFEVPDDVRSETQLVRLLINLKHLETIVVDDITIRKID